jgi:hypothetical protein
MPRYSAVWLEIARAQYDSYPIDVQQQIDTKLDQLVENPAVYGDYDKRTDQWTTTYGAGTGLIAYAIVRAHQKIIVLRLV